MSETPDQPQDEGQDSGSFNQDDIDALLQAGAGAEAGDDSGAEGADPAAEDGGSFSQDDVDALLQADSGATEAAASGDEVSPPEADAGGTVGQDDIDAMFQTGGDDAAPSAPGGETGAAADGDAAISQDDIDALFGGGGDATPEPSVTADKAVSQDDIDTLLSGTTGQAGSDAPAEPDRRLDSEGRPFDEAAAAMAAAIAADKAEAAADAPPPEPLPNVQPLELQEFAPPEAAGDDAHRVTMLNDVSLRVKIELGRTRMLVEDVLHLGEGSVVELDKLAGDPVDVIVNDRLIARGEVLVLNDNFCVRISDVLEDDPHRVSA